MRIETLCVHAGTAPDAVTGAIAPPIHLSTTFERDADGEFRRGFKYARDLNPTRQALERAMALVEGGQGALAFASGQAATAAVFQALKPGDHVIVPDSVYYGTPKLVNDLFVPWGLRVTSVPMDDLGAVAAALDSSTRLIWVETPSNPLLTITDIAGVVAIARQAGAVVVVDNTWATPVGQRPFEFGADISMHASTKYLGGHSDVMGGMLVAREDNEYFGRVRAVQHTAGGIAVAVRLLARAARAQDPGVARPRADRIGYRGDDLPCRSSIGGESPLSGTCDHIRAMKSQPVRCACLEEWPPLKFAEIGLKPWV